MQRVDPEACRRGVAQHGPGWAGPLRIAWSARTCPFARWPVCFAHRAWGGHNPAFPAPRNLERRRAMNKEDKGIRVVIADDHFIVREGLRLILETDPEMELVGDAPDGASAVRLAGEAQPDVVLMDLRMPC